MINFGLSVRWLWKLAWWLASMQEERITSHAHGKYYDRKYQQ